VNNISIKIDNEDIFIAFSYHPFSIDEIKKDPKYIFKWLGSIIVRVLTLSQFSHVDVVSPSVDDDNNNIVLGSVPDGGLLYRQQNTNSYYELYKHTVEDKEERTRFLEHIENYIGSKYDWLSIVGFAIPKRDWNSKDKWFCSEIIASAFNKIGHTLGEGSHRVSPVDLLRYPRLLERVYIDEKV